jgi:hypothetical protein
MATDPIVFKGHRAQQEVTSHTLGIMLRQRPEVEMAARALLGFSLRWPAESAPDGIGAPGGTTPALRQGGAATLLRLIFMRWLLLYLPLSHHVHKGRDKW